MAHHSTTMFDMQKTAELKGTIKEFKWTNPHTWTVVTVEGVRSHCR
jgi:phage-related protein